MVRQRSWRVFWGEDAGEDAGEDDGGGGVEGDDVRKKRLLMRVVMKDIFFCVG